MWTEFTLAFAITSLLIELTPGPNMAYLALVSALEGRKSGLAAVAGVALGLTVIGSAAALGLAALIEASPVAYQVLRWGGAAYLVWLAWDAWRGDDTDVEAEHEPRTLWKHFRRGFVVNVLNPKAGLFYIAILPGFIDPERAIGVQTATLTAIYVAVATGVHLLLVALAGTASRFFTDGPRERMARRVFAALLVGVAIWFLVASR